MKTYFLDLIRGKETGPRAEVLRTLLHGASGVYSAGLSGRACLYSSGIMKARRLPVPVISVGNLTWGGTGKTPLILWLVRNVQKTGRRPAVLTRGYGNDEWKEISARFPDIPLGIGSDRIQSAGEILSRGNCDVMICDDAFQHWRLARDWDIVTVNAAAPFGNGFLIPRGELREPPEALRRAGTVVLTHANRVSGAGKDALRKQIAGYAPGAEWAEAVHEAAGFFRAATGETRPHDALRGQNAVCVSGIGSPDLFSGALEAAGLRLIEKFAFPDHHVYRPADLDAVRKAAGDAAIITTEKDYHREPGIWKELNAWVYKIEFRVTEGEEKLLARLAALVPPAASSKEKVYA